MWTNHMVLAPNNLLGIQWSSEIFLLTFLTALRQLPSPVGSTFPGIYLCESYPVILLCSHKRWPTKFLLWCICLGLCVRVQLLSPIWLFAALWTLACQAPLSVAIFQSLLRFMHTESVVLSNHLVVCPPLLLWPSIKSDCNIYCVKDNVLGSLAVTLFISYSKPMS